MLSKTVKKFRLARNKAVIKLKTVCLYLQKRHSVKNSFDSRKNVVNELNMSNTQNRNNEVDGILLNQVINLFMIGRMTEIRNSPCSFGLKYIQIKVPNKKQLNTYLNLKITLTNKMKDHRNYARINNVLNLS